MTQSIPDTRKSFLSSLVVGQRVCIAVPSYDTENPLRLFHGVITAIGRKNITVDFEQRGFLYKFSVETGLSLTRERTTLPLRIVENPEVAANEFSVNRGIETLDNTLIRFAKSLRENEGLLLKSVTPEDVADITAIIERIKSRVA